MLYFGIIHVFSGCSKEKPEEKDGKESSALATDKSQPENQVEELDISAEEGQPADGFVWEHNYSEITITGYQGSSNSLVIPAKINGKPVTLIAKEAFKNFTALESVIINGASYKFIAGTFEEETDYCYNESYAVKEESDTDRYYVVNNPEYEEYVYRY